ncbi:MAG: phage Gp37/Gp68 family protein [Bacteroidales bacterium]|nr:phage Gp37/Gp68 family protein [Bacteroidales bacterium]
MANRTEIAWTEYSLNPITGCTHAGTPECDNCYAKTMARRLKAMHNPHYMNGFTPTFHPEVLKQIPKIPSGALVFLPSMSDLFHKDFSVEIIEQIVSECEKRQDVTFQILTKRAERMAEFFKNRPVPKNFWLGVTCGHEDSLYRVDILRTIDAPVRWISAEPLLSDITPNLDLTSIDWVVVGGESGPKARPMQEDWVWNLKEKCEESDVAFFLKQWGTYGVDGIRRKKSENGCLLKGSEYKSYPTPR